MTQTEAKFVLVRALQAVGVAHLHQQSLKSLTVSQMALLCDVFEVLKCKTVSEILPQAPDDTAELTAGQVGQWH